MNCKPIFGEIPPAAKDKFAFVIMPLEPELSSFYDSIIKPVVESKGLECRRADHYKTNTAIMRDIWNAICQSKVVIAEMTGFNGNVMYELGISHTVGKETIMMIQENSAKAQKFPFDMSHIRRIQYRDTMPEYPRLKNSLSLTLDFVLEQGSTVAIESKEEEAKAVRESTIARKLGYTVLRRVNVGRRNEKDGLAVTVYSVDFRDDTTKVELKIENESTREASLLTSYSYAIQRKRQFRCTDAKDINTHVPPGVVEEGELSFETIDHTRGNIVFYFDFANVTLQVEVELI